MKMVIMLILGTLLINGAFAQEECECSDLETIHVLNNPEEVSVIDNDTCPASKIFIALPKENMPKRMKFVISQNANSFIIELKDKKKAIEGSVYNYGNVLYGGNFKLGENLRVNGVVGYNKAARILDINHNHEFAIYRLDLDRLTLEPTIHQYAKFFNNSSLGMSVAETIIQPASFGVFVRKENKHGQEFKAGMSAGPGLNFTTMPSGTDFKFRGYVNLRLSIPL